MSDWSGTCRRIVDARGGPAQLPQYLAVLAGLRRTLDDWVAIDRIADYRSALTALGLTVEIDCLFRHLDRGVAGANAVPTTRASASRYAADAPVGQGQVHVFVSTRRDWAVEALAAGWYSVAVGGRIVAKPRIDHLWLGRAFGYPECCVRFFLQFNDWPRMNSFAEAARASRTVRWETNCLGRHTPLMGPFHLPCRFDCEATCRYTTELLAVVRAHDPSYADRIRGFLRQPFLVASEVLCYALVGARPLGHGAVGYHDVLYVGGKPHEDRWSEVLARGNQLELGDGIVHVTRDDAQVGTLEARCDRGRMELPLLLDFR